MRILNIGLLWFFGTCSTQAFAVDFSCYADPRTDATECLDVKQVREENGIRFARLYSGGPKTGAAYQFLFARKLLDWCRAPKRPRRREFCRRHRRRNTNDQGVKVDHLRRSREEEVIMRISLATLSIVVAVSGCASPVPTEWVKEGANPLDRVAAENKCDYETSAATQGINTGYRTIFGQELDRAMRQGELYRKCMVANGWYLRTLSR